MCTCQAFWSSSQLAKSRAYISIDIHMAARAVLPNASAREWLLAGLLDRANGHWIRAPRSMGGDEDTDTGTDTTAPDDDIDDIASSTSQQTTAIHTPSL